MLKKNEKDKEKKKLEIKTKNNTKHDKFKTNHDKMEKEKTIIQKKIVKKHIDIEKMVKQKRREADEQIEYLKANNHIRVDNMQMNLLREKRKTEWKRLNLMAKDRISGERFVQKGREFHKLMRVKSELDVERDIDRLRIKDTLSYLSHSSIKDKGTKRFLQTMYPDLEVEKYFL